MRAYEDVLYDDYPFVLAHPARLRAIGQILGLPPTRRPQRVLDLGCGLGGHLIALAAHDPDGAYVGIDLSPAQIDAGQATIDTLGLDNVTLLAADLLDLPTDLGRFDIITCHGVYSWIPEPVRQRIWQICRAHLAPNGVAYVSANMKPGWVSRGALREILLQTLPESGTAAERVAAARQTLEHLRTTLSSRPSGSIVSLLEDVLDLSGRSDAYLLYEYLAEINEPFWFKDLHAAATEQGLSYVGDALFSSHFNAIPEATEAWIDSEFSGPVGREQAQDLVTHRMFRRSLWTHREATLDLELHWRRLQGLLLSCSYTADPNEPGRWRGPGDTHVRAEDAATAGLIGLLCGRAPQAMLFEDVLDELHSESVSKAAIGKAALHLFCHGVVEAWSRLPDIHTVVCDHPAASPLARLQAARGDSGAVNLRHERYLLKHTDRAVLQHLDGQHSHAQLASSLQSDALAERVEIRIDDVLRTDLPACEAAVSMVLDRMRLGAFLTKTGS
ncbi:MAG: methyltransferase domain-containing protein [Myxococcota bacterium]